MAYILSLVCVVYLMKTGPDHCSSIEDTLFLVAFCFDSHTQLSPWPWK